MQIKDSSSRLSRIHVMVSDNDEKIIDLMTGILKTLGFGKVYTAKDGFEAIGQLNRNKVDLIITDWELSPINEVIYDDKLAQWGPLPPENGASFVKCIRETKNSPNSFLPIIMVTGHALQSNIEYARDAGVDDILVKPVSADDLCKRIIKIINTQRTFIHARSYKGPCRRRRDALTDKENDRRKVTPKISKHSTV